MTGSTVKTSTENRVNLSESPIRVLTVDDDSDFLKIMKRILEALDAFQVDIAVSVDDAMDKLKDTTYDAVVSDYLMPGKNGLDFLKGLRDSGNTLPFI
jgi:DNA-binding NtrC family response regulator